MPQIHPSARWRQRLPLIVLAVAAVIAFVTLRDLISFEALRDNRTALLAFRDENYLVTALGFIAAYIAVVALSLPGAAIATLTGGFLFGLFPGALFNLVGATTGAILIFLAVRAGLGRSLAAKINARDGRAKQLAAALRENEIPVLISLRLMPVLPFWVTNILLGLLGVRLWVFAATTFFGSMPGGVIYTWVGMGLGDVFARDETPDLGIIFEPHILGPLLGLAALSFLPMLVKRWRKTDDLA